MSAIKITGLTNDAKEAYNEAVTADKAWQAELDARKIDRYSAPARGVDDNNLRKLYNAKVAADGKLRELTELVRRYQDPRQIGIELSEAG